MKKLLLVMLTALLGCASNPDAKMNVVATHAMFEAFNRHDWEKMASYYSNDAQFLDPSYGNEYVKKTRNETAAKYAELEKMFPNIHDEIVEVYPSDQKIIVEFISTGSASDSLQFKLPIITVLTFKDGLIVKDATYYDLENP